MKTRTIVTILIAFLCLGTLFSQTILTRSLQSLRSGDVISKQQVEYKDPGRRGNNVIWDFSRLKATNKEYGVSYFEPNNNSKDTLYVTGVEHNTMYKFALAGDSLFSLGFENTGSQLVLSSPELNMVYPFTLGDSIIGTYNGTGRYMNTLLTQTQGDLTTVADAMGTLILPGEDTLYHVLRVRSEHRYLQRSLPISNEEEFQLPKTDTLNFDEETEVLAVESSNNTTNGNEELDNGKSTCFGKKHGKANRKTRGQMLSERTDSSYYRTETCRWYASGYRYPLFETICNKGHQTKKDTSEITDIATAFYFPPSLHSYLENDPENKAILDSIALAKETDNEVSSDSLLFDYNYYPNPVQSELNVELLLDLPSDVTIRIADSSGKIVITSQEGYHPAGINHFKLKTNRLRMGEYLLHIVVNKQTAHALLLKI